MTTEIVLNIIAIVISAAALACVIVLFVVGKRKNNGSDDEERLRRLSESLNSEINGITGYIKATDDNLFKNIATYNESVLASIKGMSDFSKSAQNDLERRFSEFVNNIEIKLSNMRREITDGMTEVRKENQVQLKEMRETVDEKLTSTLNDRISKSFGVISERLDAVSKGLGEMKNLSDGVVSLNKVLSNVKTRGNWGELSLDNILAQTLTPEQYCVQHAIGGSGNKVDFAIVLPGSGKGKVYLPIDAKFPLEDYERLVDASENGDKAAFEAAGKALTMRIKEEAKSISEKYVKPPETTDFALLYLPIEGLFAEAVRRAGLCDELQNKYRVVLCGPTTVTALLNSLQIGFRTLAIQQRSGEIWKLLSAFKTDFEKFSVLLSKTQKQVDNVSDTIRDANKRTEIIQKKLNKVQTLLPEEGGAPEIGEGDD